MLARFCLFMILCSFFVLSEGSRAARADPVPVSPREHAFAKLRNAEVSSELIELLQKGQQNPKARSDRDLVVALNVLGFLGKADYSGHYSEKGLQSIRRVLKRYATRFARVEKSHGVPKEVIASLLWVETKHGRHIGRHKVLDVYYSLIQSDHPEVMRSTLEQFKNKAPDAPPDQRQKVIDRSYAKANWALRELKSLDEIRKRNAKELKTLRGSYAGAFGIPQFIPSSYLQWARSAAKKKHPDLFKMEDAIQSVGFYLKANGWKPGDAESQRAALFHYNRSDEYVNVILKLAQAVK